LTAKKITGLPEEELVRIRERWVLSFRTGPCLIRSVFENVAYRLQERSEDEDTIERQSWRDPQLRGANDVEDKTAVRAIRRDETARSNRPGRG